MAGLKTIWHGREKEVQRVARVADDEKNHAPSAIKYCGLCRKGREVHDPTSQP